MKPIAYMGHYDTDNIREAGCVVTRDKDDLKFQRNGKPDRIDELYTADQLREAQVKALMKAVALVDLRAGRTIRRLIAKLEKDDAIRGLA